MTVTVATQRLSTGEYLHYGSNLHIVRERAGVWHVQTPEGEVLSTHINKKLAVDAADEMIVNEETEETTDTGETIDDKFDRLAYLTDAVSRLSPPTEGYRYVILEIPLDL